MWLKLVDTQTSNLLAIALPNLNCATHIGAIQNSKQKQTKVWKVILNTYVPKKYYRLNIDTTANC